MATVVFTVTQVIAAFAPRGIAGLVAVVFSLVLFAVGSVVFVVAFGVAAARSRDDRVTMPGMVWLVDAAPPAVARALRLALVAQCIVALVTAGLRPFSALAFGILAPMSALAAIAWYAARHGTFAAIVVDPSSAPGPAVETTMEPTVEATASADEQTAERADPDDFDQLFRRRKRRGSPPP